MSVATLRDVSAAAPEDEFFLGPARVVEMLRHKGRIPPKRLAVSGIGTRSRRAGWADAEEVIFVFMPPDQNKPLQP